MKKITAFLLALLMACLTIPALMEDDVTGEWYGNVFGVNATLTLNPDGTYVLSASGQDLGDGSWELQDGVVYLDEKSDESAFVYDGESLRNDAMDTTFTRNADDANAITLADVDPQAPLESFAGEWICAYLGVNGMVLDAQAAPLSKVPTMKISGTSLNMDLSGFTSLFSALPELPCTYENGTLTADFGASASSVSVTVQMLEDGMTVLTMDAAGQTVQFYFVPAAAEEAPAA